MAKRKYYRKVYRKRKKWPRRLLKIFGLFLLAIFLSGILVFIYYIKDLPRPEKFTEGTIAQSTKIYDRTGEMLLYEISGEEKRTVVSLEKIPDYLKWAVVVAEDASFYQHRGLDFKAIVRAVLYDLKLGKFIQGGSTISQQLIRSYFLTRKKTLERKTREIILTLELERRYPKDQILEWYLNLIPMGGNLYGMEAATQTFFQKHISDVSLAEAVTLASLIRAPSYLSPYGAHLDELLARKNYILERMEKAGYLTEEEKLKAKEEDIKFYPNIDIIRAPHFVMYVNHYLEEKYGQFFLEKAGLKVYTTLDWELQGKAETIVEDGVEGIKGYNAHNGALVALSPKTGEILVMVGSKNWYGESEFCSESGCKFDPKTNATLSLRQPGSAFKPFVYATAFEKGLTPNSIIWDTKTEFNVNCSPSAIQTYGKYNSKCYHPKNYDERFLGSINFRTALAQSRNVPSVKVLYLAGKDETLDLAQEFGITTLKDKGRYGLSLVLGGGEVKLLEMVSAFGVFAKEGVKTPLNFIRKIEDSEGNIIEEMKKAEIRVLPSQIAREINDILSDNESRAPMFGWRSPLYLEDYKVAAKTGTTQDYRDAWTIGYTPNLVTGVWVGNNDNTPMTKPGVTLAGPIFQKFMREALEKFEREEFEAPQEILTGKPILDGVLPGPHSVLYYLEKENPKGEEPKNPSQDPQYFNWEEGVQNWLKFH
ncbi:transglycosylase domain-containing protein [Patescibacteria group bacterium]|nr:transglycosylase domain-containing protein [Patescibacteria group bacterium]